MDEPVYEWYEATLTLRLLGIVMVLVAVAAVVGVVYLDRSLPPEEDTTTALQVVTPPDNGVLYCAGSGNPADTATLTIASVDPENDTEVTVRSFGDEITVGDPATLAAGSSVGLDLVDASSGVSITWRGGPISASQSVTFEDGDAGIIQCKSNPGTVWHLAGFNTTRGNTSTIALFNPFPEDAVVQLTFGTPDGGVDLVLTEELAIDASSVTTFDLADYQPEVQDLAVTVVARIGRVVPGGRITRGPAGDGLDAVKGSDVVPAEGTPSTTVDFPEVVVDGALLTTLTVYNPNDTSVGFRTVVTTPQAGRPTSEVVLPAGATVRLSLNEMSAEPRFGVRIENSERGGLVAVSTTAYLPGQGTGLAIQQGVAEPDTSWAVNVTEDVSVTVFNPGVTEAEVAFDGAAIDPVTVPPNMTVRVDIPESFSGVLTADSDNNVVAGTAFLSGTEGPMWRVPGTPISALFTETQVLEVVRDAQLGTTPVLSTTVLPELEPIDESFTPDGSETSPEPSDVPSSIPTVETSPSPGPSSVPASVPNNGETEVPVPVGESEVPVPVPTPTATGPTGTEPNDGAVPDPDTVGPDEETDDLFG